MQKASSLSSGLQSPSPPPQPPILSSLLLVASAAPSPKIIRHLNGGGGESYGCDLHSNKLNFCSTIEDAPLAQASAILQKDRGILLQTTTTPAKSHSSYERRQRAPASTFAAATTKSASSVSLSPSSLISKDNSRSHHMSIGHKSAEPNTRALTSSSPPHPFVELAPDQAEAARQLDGSNEQAGGYHLEQQRGELESEQEEKQSFNRTTLANSRSQQLGSKISNKNNSRYLKKCIFIKRAQRDLVEPAACVTGTWSKENVNSDSHSNKNSDSKSNLRDQDSREEVDYYLKKLKARRERQLSSNRMSQTLQSIHSLSMQLNRAASLRGSSGQLGDELEIAGGQQANGGKFGASRLTRLVGKKASRVKEILLQNLGKADKTTDELFQMYEQNFYRQQGEASRLQKEFKSYVQSLKGAQEASKSLNACIQHSTNYYQSARHDLVCENLSQLEHLDEDLMDKLRSQVLISVNEYLSQFNELRDKIAKRRRKLIDFDSSRRVYELTLASVNRKRMQQQQATGANYRSSLTLDGSPGSRQQPSNANPADPLGIQSAASQLVDEARLLKLREQYNYCRVMYETINGELHEELPMVYEKKMKNLLMTLQNYFSLEAQFHLNAGKLFATASDVIDELPMSGLQMAAASRNNHATGNMQSLDRSRSSAVSLSAHSQENESHLREAASEDFGVGAKTSALMAGSGAGSSSGMGSSSSGHDSSLESSSSMAGTPSGNGAHSPAHCDHQLEGADDEQEEEEEPEELEGRMVIGGGQLVGVDTDQYSAQVEPEVGAMQDRRQVAEEEQVTKVAGSTTDVEEEAPVAVSSLAVDQCHEEEEIGDTKEEKDVANVVQPGEKDDGCTQVKAGQAEKKAPEVAPTRLESVKRNEQEKEQVAGTCGKEPRCLYKVKTSYKYLAEDVDELCFEADEIIQVVEFDENQDQEEGWLMGIREVNGQKGLFPANFTLPI